MLGSIMDEFSQDVAMGQGEALNAVAVMICVAKEVCYTFAKVTDDNFATLFPSESVTAEEVLASLEDIINADSKLAKYVG